MSTKDTTPIDAVVGRNVRFHQLAAGMSQHDLGRKVGVSFQQIQKYEKGINRLGAGRLVRIAQIFDVHISVLFDGASAVPREKRSGKRLGELIADPQTLRLAKAFADISDIAVRRCIVGLIEQIARR